MSPRKKLRGSVSSFRQSGSSGVPSAGLEVEAADGSVVAVEVAIADSAVPPSLPGAAQFVIAAAAFGVEANPAAAALLGTEALVAGYPTVVARMDIVAEKSRKAERWQRTAAS